MTYTNIEDHFGHVCSLTLDLDKTGEAFWTVRCRFCGWDDGHRYQDPDAATAAAWAHRATH